MPLRQTSNSINAAYACAVRYLFQYPNETVVLFFNPDDSYVHIIDAATIVSDADIPMISPERIRFAGTFADLCAITLATDAASADLVRNP